MEKRILVTGASGCIGQRLCQNLLDNGWSLVVLGRKTQAEFRENFSLPCEYHQWSTKKETESQEAQLREALNVDAVIHLMGESLAGRRWTKKAKKEFYSSRIEVTRNLVTAINRSARSIRVFICASAIGIYGEGEAFTEESDPGDDFLAKLCKDWEREAKKVYCRSIQLRLGLVLSNQGGALEKMVPIFKRGIGGPLSNGLQWMSWVHIDDAIGVIHAVLSHTDLEGPINVVAPNPVRNREFTKILARVLNVRASLPAPKFALRIVLGEMAEMIVMSQKVLPEKLRLHEYKFIFTSLEDALHDLYK